MCIKNRILSEIKAVTQNDDCPLCKQGNSLICNDINFFLCAFTGVLETSLAARELDTGLHKEAGSGVFCDAGSPPKMVTAHTTRILGEKGSLFLPFYFTLSAVAAKRSLMPR